MHTIPIAVPDFLITKNDLLDWRNFLLGCACTCGNSDAGVGPNPAPPNGGPGPGGPGPGGPGPGGPGPGGGRSYLVSYQKNGQTIPLSIIQPRGFKPHQDLLVVPEDAVDSNGFVQIALRATKRHNLKQISCFNANPHTVTKTTLPLKQIVKGNNSEVVESENIKGLHLLAGEQVEFVFDGKNLPEIEQGHKRIFTLRATGFYTPLTILGSVKAGNWYSHLTTEEKNILFALYLRSGRPLMEAERRFIHKAGKSVAATIASIGVALSFGFWSGSSFSKAETGTSFRFGAQKAHADVPYSQGGYYSQSGYFNTSTPLLKVWNGNEYVIENDFLFSKEGSLFASAEEGKEAIKVGLQGDLYRLDYLQLNDSKEARVLIKEIEPEESHYQSISMDHYLLKEDDVLYIDNEFTSAHVFSQNEIIENTCTFDYELRRRDGSQEFSEEKSAKLDTEVECAVDDTVTISYQVGKNQNTGKHYILIESYLRDWLMEDAIPFTFADKLTMAYMRTKKYD